MSVPDFKKFGVNTYRSRITQRDNTVILSQRTWLAAVALGVFGMIVGFFFIVPMAIKGNYIFSLGRMAGIFFFIVFELSAITFALYREEIIFDFRSKFLTLRKGFLWNVKEFSSFFNDIVAVVVTEHRMRSKGTRRTHTLFDISIKHRKEEPTFGIWQAQSKEQADYISRTLADAFGCEVVWKESGGMILEEELRDKLLR